MPSSHNTAIALKADRKSVVYSDDILAVLICFFYGLVK